MGVLTGWLGLPVLVAGALLLLAGDVVRRPDAEQAAGPVAGRWPGSAAGRITLAGAVLAGIGLLLTVLRVAAPLLG